MLLYQSVGVSVTHSFANRRQFSSLLECRKARKLECRKLVLQPLLFALVRWLFCKRVGVYIQDRESYKNARILSALSSVEQRCLISCADPLSKKSINTTASVVLDQKPRRTTFDGSEVFVFNSFLEDPNKFTKDFRFRICK